MTSTVFGRILAGEIAAERLHEDAHCIVIRDARPRAPVHLLVIPREPIACLADATDAHQALLGHLLLVARRMAQAHGIGEAFRTVINSGEGAGQSVFHLHVHVLGGQPFSDAAL